MPMNCAVSMVKMNACRKATINSRKCTKSANPTASGDAARPTTGENARPSMRRTIQTATLKSSKPELALEVARRAEERGVPPALRALIEKACELARMRPRVDED